MRWKIKSQKKEKDIFGALLALRGLTDEEKIKNYLFPPLPSEFLKETLKISSKELKKAVGRICEAIEKKEQIVIYGDYDVDGVSGTAILWKTLKSLEANVSPYLPHRETEGYGLSIKGITNVKRQNPGVKLIITVDNGITAREAVNFAKKEDLTVVIVDHHEKPKELPHAYAIIHSLKLCGAGLAWILSKEIKNAKLKMPKFNESLELVGLATIADMVPLTGANRSFAKYGLEALNKTKNIGLLALMKTTGLEGKKIGAYEVGYILGPRLNASGRLEHAMDSLRLLCVDGPKTAKTLAEKLNATNRERQLITEETILHAQSLVDIRNLPKLLFVHHDSYNQGVIGLAAGKLVDKYYRPSIVAARGEIYSKASCRSIGGFNIIKALRKTGDLLIDCGGHPLAAGFTVETKSLKILEKRLLEIAEEELDIGKLTKILDIDLEIDLSVLNLKLYEKIAQMEPFGIGNPEPVFVSRATVSNWRLVGSEGKHLKLTLEDKQGRYFEAIGFGMGGRAKEVINGHEIEAAYNLTGNEWNGKKNIQLRLKDIHLL